MALAVMRDLREQRSPTTAEELADYETDLLAGFVLARASAGLADSTIRNDTNHLELIRDWFDRPLWEMQPTDADAYFGKVLRAAKAATRTGRAGALAVFFEFLELRYRSSCTTHWHPPRDAHARMRQKLGCAAALHLPDRIRPHRRPTSKPVRGHQLRQARAASDQVRSSRKTVRTRRTDDGERAGFCCVA